MPSAAVNPTGCRLPGGKTAWGSLLVKWIVMGAVMLVVGPILLVAGLVAVAVMGLAVAIPLLPFAIAAALVWLLVRATRRPAVA